MGITRAVILAAGKGTRLLPLTRATPKCLVPLAGRPLLDFWCDALASAGIRDVLINSHSLPEQVRQYIHALNQRGGMRWVESFEPDLLGSAGTLAANPTYAEGTQETVIIYADNLSSVDLSQMLTYHRSHGDPMTMLLFHASDPRACGIVELDAEDRVIGYVEKPSDPRSGLANAGVYILDAPSYKEVADMNAFDFGFDVLPKFVGRMRGYVMEGLHLDIGTPDNYALAQSAAERLLADRGFNQMGQRPAVFLDRDGTLIEPVHYLSSPDDVRLVEGASGAIRRLRGFGYAIVVVSNQSAVGRGIITEEDVREINSRMCGYLEEQGAVIDALYHCPTVPTVEDRTVMDPADDSRKPGPGMLRQASVDLGIDLTRSWMVGDMISDALAGINAGCRGSFLIRPAARSGLRHAGFTEAQHLRDAVQQIVEASPTQ